MEEDPGVKAPVTRLRRRLSVESEGAQSPSTPSTPTKKRATRLAKPALELIDENVTENVPKRSSRRSVARDAVEPVEDKTLTPSRRSTRIRSNTSLVAETAATVSSPRAARAARRNSQLGSDTETATTPARQTRRTRKDSTSSVEKLAISNLNEKATAPVADAIVEEPEKEVVKESPVKSSPSQPLRKSPRLNKIDKENVKDVNTEQEQKDKAQNNSISQSLDTVTTNETLPNEDRDNKNITEKENLSISSSKLINDVESKPKVPSSLNKTTSAVTEQKSSEKSNRKRTKSWTTITNKMTENIDININNNEKSKNLGCSGDVITGVNDDINNKILNPSNKKSVLNFNSSVENKENILHMKSEDVLDATETAKMLQMIPSINMQSVVLMEDSDSNTGSLGKNNIDIQNDRGEQNDTEDQCVPVVKQHTPKRTQSESFVCEPMDIDETIPPNVTLADFSDKTDSSREEDTADNHRRESSLSSEHKNNEANKLHLNSPMSVQQRLTNLNRKSSIRVSEENSSGTNKTDKSLNNISLNESNKSKRKSSVSLQQENQNTESKSYLEDCRQNKADKNSSIMNEDSNRSKKKNLASEMETQRIEKTSNENKSTLVLSQLKDLSTNDTGNASKLVNDSNNELSKSVIPDLSKDEKKNVPPGDYLTSTPLQQKPLQKIAINSSIIGLGIDSKNNTNVEVTPKKKQYKGKLDDGDSESSDEESRKNSMIDDEAEEATDDYESGDSRDDDERQYEEENEIVEKGETLESEKDFSDDSDYEKDSFVVSSDEEDEELLSGSGDDLSLSDKELKMTAKSKKKFNKRKLKEQKKASREMYEARHKLKKSEDKSSKKNKSRKQLESSSSDSDENDAQPKKSNRLRIDSSQEVTLNKSDNYANLIKKNRLRINSSQEISLNKSDGKKKKWQLSESVCDEDRLSNEKEITIYNQSPSEKNDPLLIAIKQEPKTPQRNLNISTIQIHNDIEEVQLNKSCADKSCVSILKQNETSDPLQGSLCQDDDTESDISENMEIKENYDSVLEKLNKSNKQKNIKMLDTSLNFNKKTKGNGNDSIMDKLNLTVTKETKKAKKGQATKDNIVKQPESKNNMAAINDDGDTSDSIDMKLLFPEDSNDSEVNAIQFKTTENKTEEAPAEEFIPLRKSVGKTNIHENMDLNGSQNNHDLIDSSKRKKKNRKSSQSINEELIQDEPDNANVSFFIDTQGSYGEMETSAQTNAKKNKKKTNKGNNSTLPGNEAVVTTAETNEQTAQTEDTESPLEVPTKSDKKKKNKHQNIPINNEEISDLNISTNGKKNKHRTSESTVEGCFVNNQEITFTEYPLEVSFKSDKKKKKRHSVSMSDEKAEDRSLNKEKNGTKLSVSVSDINRTITDISEHHEDSLVKDKINKKKEKHSVSISEEHIVETSILEVSKISKMAKNVSELNKTADAALEELTLNISQSSEKKKKKKKKSLEASKIVENTAEDLDEGPVEVSYKDNRPNLDVVEVVPDEATHSGKKNKKKKNKSLSLEEPIQEEMVSKKRKREMNENEVNTSEFISDAQTKQNKKLKTFQNDDGSTEDKNTHSMDHGQEKYEGVHLKKSKKNKKSKQDIPSVTDKVEAPQHKPKKRKADDDNSQKISKVLKQNSLDNIHVPRLPESIISQLENKPSRSKKLKTKAISTTEFEVEAARIRNSKPSTYLEESVYLNDSMERKKKKSSFKKPKVLPFTPTAITSDQGFTTNFKINVLPQQTEFVAQASNISNFKNDYLSKQRSKKLGTYELYKRNYKISKF